MSRVTDRRHRWAVPAAVLSAGLVLAGCSSGTSVSPATSAVAARSSGAPSAAAPTPLLPALPATPGPLPASSTSVPTSVSIPSIGVTSSLEALGLLPNGAMASPSQYPVAGWYAGGVRPGDDGPAIIAGHVDSYKGPAVFYKLDKLKAGDPVIVTRADGSTVTFVVDSMSQYPKSNFPTEAVYGPTPTPELRLITCTGIFDRSIRSYESNLVVRAVLAP